ncbi:DUF2490 domain-containing protein [Mucilaginibacter pallidiroseus]|uniref:DUF2490 domain-containing protein n=1 Tax=Mucilaginibacter pallidiroseus TaxID=2599295 RepID=A0A563UGM9_9SPHI|nr:DUF2490 domain-containing protein [Mucilaginibacter pallidiroseus]TWR30550.1 DUF2490 domain-containing protein [Mucilaginibacter pallidiroseus]
MLKLVFKAALTIIFTISLSTVLKAQNYKTGTWGIATITLPGDSAHHWGGYIELQARANEIANQFFYYETKGGVSYDIAKNYIALIGTGRYVTKDFTNLEAPPTVQEFRLWEQFTINSFLDRLKLEHRYRAEQRWLNGIYRNRFRYRLNVVVPLNHKKVEAKTYFISVFDELFFNNKAPHFERNRFSAAFGYQFDKSLSVQAGYLDQYNYNLTSSGAKNNIAIVVQYRINRKNSKPKEHIPGAND